MASIEPRGGNAYRLVASCGYDGAGKKIRKRKTVTLPDGLTERQKEKELNRLAVLFEQEVENGTFLDGERVTLAEFIEIWLRDHAERRLAPTTLRGYKYRLANRVIPALGHIRLAKIQPHHLLEFYNNLTEENIRKDVFFKAGDPLIAQVKNTKTRGVSKTIGIDPKTFKRFLDGERINREAAEKICAHYGADFKKNFKAETPKDTLSSKTVKHHHDLISAVLSTAVKWNLLTSNPAERVGAPKVPQTQAKYYDDGQVMELLALLNAAPVKYKTAIYLTLDTGLRLSEVAGLKWNDVDLNEKALRISRQRQYVAGYGTFEKDPKTLNSLRSISISDTVIDLLKAYKAHQAANRARMKNLWYMNDNIFTHENGKPMFPCRPSQWFKQFIAKNNLPPITFHELRHTNASLLIASDIDIVTVSGRLGHADKNVTLRTYSHVIKSKERTAANAMDNLYGRRNGGQTDTAKNS